MRKGKIANIAGGAAVVGLSLVLMDKTKRDSMMSKMKKMSEKVSNKFSNSNSKNNSNLPIEESGDPGRQGIQNSNMVAEGSQFGVNYYNKTKQ
ncbi:hypothetical protein F9U64_03095 [Gracilibacillus oryzae]|uniref:YtxH domain-containing protein n=1 Tax=Gracilibacillus oryzae TaxID=1672701 RepID=A0A7C8L5F5_9BACI|nr:hypothetical protein [Gracilibacillus oryzae]KAB8138616.1 hypothetical protein F9U64_03095 [Gracilibacillus oryzae]